MTHHSSGLHPLLLLAVLFVLPTYSTAGHVDGERADEVAYRIYYLFDPADDAELHRAAAVHRTTLDRTDVEWVGIRRTATLSVPFAPMALDDMLANVDHLPASVVRWLEYIGGVDRTTDQVLLEDTSTRRTFAGAGAELREISNTAGLGDGIRTDVAVTTWGKVKELFR